MGEEASWKAPPLSSGETLVASQGGNAVSRDS